MIFTPLRVGFGCLGGGGVVGCLTRYLFLFFIAGCAAGMVVKKNLGCGNGKGGSYVVYPV